MISIKQRVYNFLAEQRQPINTDTVADSLEITKSQAMSALNRLRKYGHAKRVQEVKSSPWEQAQWVVGEIPYVSGQGAPQERQDWDHRALVTIWQVKTARVARTREMQ